MKKIVIAKMPVNNKNSLAAVCFEENTPLEFFVCPEEDRPGEGSIFTGIVEKVDERLGAAFVRFGKDVSGYLPLKKAGNVIFAGPKREGGLRPNDRILVMVEKAAVKTKHCVLTADISISGKYLVVHSDRTGKISYSRKLAKSEAGKIAADMAEIVPDPDDFFSVTVRTLAADAGIEKLGAEYVKLQELMQRIVQYGVSRPYGTCLYSGSTPWADMLKRVPDHELQKIVTDSAEVFSDLTERLCPLLDIGPSRAEFYDDSMIDLFRLYNLGALLSKITSEKVNLRSGANLNIETTEAFVVIDVNSANATKKYRNSSSFLPVNLEAAEEIASQIRLRQLSGIILIDFINMKDPKEEKELIGFFKGLISRDPVKTGFVDITKLGIMEVTREKRYGNIFEQIRSL